MVLSPDSSMICEMASKSSCGYSSPKDPAVPCVLDLSKCSPHDERLPPVSPPLATPMLAATQNVLSAVNSTHTRPFKEYTKRSLSLNASSDPDFIRYRDQMLPKLQNIALRRDNVRPKVQKTEVSSKKPRSESPTDKESQDSSKWIKDATYWERRRKNNEAAKRSRELRRSRHEQLALRVSFLKNQNMELKCQAEELAKENFLLKKMMLYTKEHSPLHTIQHPNAFIPPHLPIRYPSNDLRYRPESASLST